MSLLSLQLNTRDLKIIRKQIKENEEHPDIVKKRFHKHFKENDLEELTKKYVKKHNEQISSKIYLIENF